MINVITKNAELVEIRKSDGAQTYKYYEDNKTKYETITGFPMASNVKIGDKGSLIYKSTCGYGLIFFEKNKE